MPELESPPLAVQRGTVTLLFTDVEGSTRLLQRFGEASVRMLEDHKAILREAFAEHGGREVDTAGDGFFVVFESAGDALAAALAAQQRLAAHAWPAGEAVRVRMGMHTGEPIVAGDRYLGLDVHRAARISAAGHGGQVLLSATTRHLVAHGLAPHITLRDLGEHRLKDLQQPEHVYQASVPGLPVEFPPLRSQGAGQSNLPPEGTPLVGREEELQALHRLLVDGQVRLLTLTGPGGTGKTRLALHAAAEMANAFPDGVVLVQLAATPDAALVASAIAQALSLNAGHDETLDEAVVTFLRTRSLLLVLDNFEHVVGAAGGVAELLRACPRIKALVTSRIALNLTLEREFPVAPLALPDPRRERTAAQLLKYAAVELFAQRAAAINPTFRLDEESAPSVAEICRRLDGLPLAIELAAARVRIFPPRALLARLDHRLELLSGGARDMPARHRTLRQAIAWSHDLLDAAEQALFRRLAVFAGGATLEAIEAVCTAAGELSLSALDGVSALVDKSLLRQDTSDDDEPRFMMLETIREFALEQLGASGEEAVTRAAHADFYIDLAERAEPELTGPMQLKWLERVARDHDNYRAVFAWAEAATEATRGVRLGAALWRFWVVRGHMSEGRARLARMLALPSAGVPLSVRQKALSGAATMAHEEGALAESQMLGEEALEVARAAGDRVAEGRTLTNLGWIALHRGDHVLARDLSNQGLHIHREAKDVRGIALALNNLGWLATIETDLAEAVRLHEESLSLRRSLGDARGVAFAQGNLAWPLIKFGEFTRANALIADSIDTLRALGDQQLLAFGLILLGELRIAEDRLEEASSALMEAMGHASDIGHKWDAIEAQTRLGAVQLELGDLDNALATAELCSQAASVEFRWVGARAIRLLANCKRALNRLDEANTLLAGATRRFAELGARGEVLECLVCAAALAAARQDWERVALSSGALNALRTQLGIVLPPMQLRHLEAADESARHAMDPLELARFRELGATLQWRDVVGHITTL